jgi:hypothetical protein
MKGSRFSEEQIVGVLKEAEAAALPGGRAVHAVSEGRLLWELPYLQNQCVGQALQILQIRFSFALQIGVGRVEVDTRPFGQVQPGQGYVILF